MSISIQLTREDLNKINNVIEQCKDVDQFEFIYDGSSGIGYTLDLQIDAHVNGVKGKFVFNIIGVEKW